MQVDSDYTVSLFPIDPNPSDFGESENPSKRFKSELPETLKSEDVDLPNNNSLHNLHSKLHETEFSTKFQLFNQFKLLTFSVFALETTFEDKYLWAGCSDGTIRIYDLETFTLYQEISTHKGAVLCFAKKGDLIFSASSQSEIQVIDWRTLQVKSQFEDNLGRIFSLKIIESWLFSGRQDTSIHCFDISPFSDPSEKKKVFSSHTGFVYCLETFEDKLLSGLVNSRVFFNHVTLFSFSIKQAPMALSTYGKFRLKFLTSTQSKPIQSQF